jgi:hypothetical protein
MHLPSAGMIRFRFDGFARTHLSPSGHPEVSANLAVRAAIARAGPGRRFRPLPPPSDAIVSRKAGATDRRRPPETRSC